MTQETDSPLTVIAAVPPALSRDQARAIAADYYGIEAEATPLTSERDQNFLLQLVDGTRYVLKIANSAEAPVVTEFQVRALEHIACRPPAGFSVPRIIPTRDGRSHFEWVLNDKAHVTRLVSYVPGRPLDTGTLSAPLCRDLGAGLAKLARALAGFEHPGSSPALLWDMRQAPILRDLLHCIGDQALRDVVAAVLDDFVQRVLPLYGSLRAQVVHNDMNPANVLVEAGCPDRMAGIIDFGDMLHAPLIVDVAVAASYMRTNDADVLKWIAEFVAGYHEVSALEQAEIDLLHDLISTRLAATAAILHWRVTQRGQGDEYLGEAALRESSAGDYLVRLRALSRDQVSARLRQACALTGHRKERSDGLPRH